MTAGELLSDARSSEQTGDLARAEAGYRQLTMAMLQQGDLDGALASCREVLRLQPDLDSAHLNMGFILSELGRRSEAMACYDRALELRPDMPEARKNRARIWLLEGKLAEGWTEFEWRWKCSELPAKQFPQPLWDGSPLDGKTVLLDAEQGFGDTIQFVRYARLVHERGGRVIVACQSPLVSLLSRCQGIEQVVAQDGPLPPFDVHAPLMSLPRIFGTTLDTIPGDVPYINADPQKVAHWREELARISHQSVADFVRSLAATSVSGQNSHEFCYATRAVLAGTGDKCGLASVSDFKIGIAWQGNPVHRGDRGRSIGLALFAPLAELPGVRLYSLQKNYGQDQLASVPFRDRVVDLSPRLNTFDDTAAVVQNLDLIIACDTSVVHLAGALGRPAWVAVSTVPDWRWLLDREDSPWYPTVRLFRQRQRGDWPEVFERITAAVAGKVGAAIAPRAIYRIVTRSNGPISFDEARRQHQAGKVEQAVELYRRVLLDDPNNAQAWYLMGAAYVQLGQLDEARASLRQATSVNPRHAEAHNHLGVVLAQQAALDEAISSFRRALEIKPDNLDALSNLGLALLRQDKAAEAITVFRRALAIKPDDARTQHNLNQALREQSGISDVTEH